MGRVELPLCRWGTRTPRVSPVVLVLVCVCVNTWCRAPDCLSDIWAELECQPFRASIRARSSRDITHSSCDARAVGHRFVDVGQHWPCCVPDRPVTVEVGQNLDTFGQAWPGAFLSAIVENILGNLGVRAIMHFAKLDMLRRTGHAVSPGSVPKTWKCSLFVFLRKMPVSGFFRRTPGSPNT